MTRGAPSCIAWLGVISELQDRVQSCPQQGLVAFFDLCSVESRDRCDQLLKLRSPREVVADLGAFASEKVNELGKVSADVGRVLNLRAPLRDERSERSFSVLAVAADSERMSHPTDTDPNEAGNDRWDCVVHLLAFGVGLFIGWAFGSWNGAL